MWIVQLALRRPYTFIVLGLLILIMGPLAIRNMPTDIFPQINIPVVSVIWRYTGLASEEMEGRITSQFERAMSATVNDIEHIESQTMNGVGVVKVFFHGGANIPTSLAQIVAIAQTMLQSFPPGATPPLILQYNASTVPILQLALSSKTIAEHELFDLSNSFMRTQLATVQGAVMPFPYGGKTRAVMVDINTQALQSKNLSALDVVNAVSNQNLILPTGTAKIGSLEYDVALNGSTASVAELNNLPVKTIAGNTIYVRDVANVRDGFQPQTNLVRHDGQRAVLVTILKYGRASTVDIVDRVKSQVPLIYAGMQDVLKQQGRPTDFEINTALDQSVFVRAAVNGVVHEAIIAGLLTAIMILLFLGSWRSTLIIAVTIPLAILTSICVLFALGETINIMTLGGLALAVGILVDDATVAIENMSQHLEQGKELDQAIIDGAQQIAIPTFVSTLAICIVFVPMFSLTGVARYLFVPLAEAVVFAMLASYFFSRTLVPTLAKYMLHVQPHEGDRPASRWNPLSVGHHAFERWFNRLRLSYRGLLQRSLSAPLLFMGLFLVIGIVSSALLPFVGRDFFPTVDAGQFKLHVRAKTGTRIEETARLCDLVEAEMRNMIPPDELATIIDNIGLPLSGTNMSYNNSGTIGTMDADIQVSLKEGHRPTEHYIRALRSKLPDMFPGVTFYFLPADIVSQILNFGLPAPIDVQVVGRNVQANRTFALGLYEKLKQVSGITDLRVQQPFDQPKLMVTVDRTKAQQAGYSQREVANNLLISLSGSFQTTPSFWLNPKNGVNYNIVTQTPQYQMDSLQALNNIPINGNSGARGEILANFANVTRESERAVISHRDVQPVIDVYGAVQGRDLGGVADEVNAIVDEARAKLPKGAQLIVRGQIETMVSSFRGLLFGLIFAIVLVYLLMVVNFQSWLDPFIIITALPAALAGIVWMLFLTHTTISVPALTGAIMAMGIATANSILVVSFARDQLRENVDAFAAAVEAGFSRFRPVLMTALAMIIGMVPMALGLGEGGEQNAPLGRAVIGGLLFATIATLFFVPVVFALIHGWRSRRQPHLYAPPPTPQA
jgi:multidrug efflux pump subunit AcrB